MSKYYATGFEHGVISSSGGGLFAALTSTTPTAYATTKRTGSYSLRNYRSGTAGTSYVQINHNSTQHHVGRFFIRFATLPSTKIDIVRTSGGGYNSYVYVDSSGKVSIKVGSGTETSDGPTLSTGTWYMIEWYYNNSANPHVMKLRVDGTSYNDATYSIAAGTNITSVNIGSTTSATYEHFIDDLTLADGSSDYPLGTAAIVGLSPAADDANENTSNSLQDASSNVIDSSTYFAWQQLDQVPISGTSTYVKQTGNYDDWMEVGFASLTPTTPRYVRALLAYKSSGTSSNNGKAYIYGDYTNTLIEGDMSETSAQYKGVTVTAPSGGWTQAKVDAVYARFGGSTDATPNPQWCNFMLEVEYFDGTSVSVSDSGSGSDGTPSIEATIPVTDSGAGADGAPAVAADVPQSDSGSGVDVEGVDMGATPIAVGDSGVGDDSGQEIEAGVPQSDSGSGSDEALIAADVPVPDSGSGSDQDPAIVVGLSESDSGSGADATPTVSAEIPQVDLGLGSDVISEVAAALELPDTGSGVDEEAVSTGSTPVPISDSGAGADADPAINVDVVIGDSGVGGYVKVGGAWVGCQIYVKVGGAWVPTS